MRMFVAVVPPPEALEHLDEFLDVRREAGDFRWAPAEQMHVTLAFLADVPERRSTTWSSGSPARRRGGPRSRPGSPAAAPSRTRPRAGALGGPRARRRRPHRARPAGHRLPGRRDPGRDRGRTAPGSGRTSPSPAPVARPRCRSWVRLLDGYAGPAWTVEAVTLVESYLGEGPRGRPRYETVDTFPLATRRAVGRVRRVRIAVAKETREGETRVAMVPELVGKLTGLGYEVVVEPDAGRHALCRDEEYVEAGARSTRDAVASADVVRLRAAAGPGRRPPAAARRRDDLVPAGQPGALAGRRPARRRRHVLRDGAGAAHLAGPVDGRAVVAGAGLRLPLRDRRGRDAAPLLPPEHDRRRHRAARRGRGARRRRRRPAGDRDRQAARRGGQGLRRARGRRRGDPVDGRQVDRPGARHPRGRRRLRPRDDRGPGAAARWSGWRRTSRTPTP